MSSGKSLAYLDDDSNTTRSRSAVMKGRNPNLTERQTVAMETMADILVVSKQIRDSAPFSFFNPNVLKNNNIYLEGVGYSL